MAELDIDQSNLPRVQEVCQSFALLEDGVLAHSLQKQEIEQYYTTNIQKNQLVQNDIRVARRLQSEEEERRAQQSAQLRQVSRQIEEQDFEYARGIQEELQRCAEEERRREQDDEEMAKQLQEEEDEEEELDEELWRRGRGRDPYIEGRSGEAALEPPPPPPAGGVHYSSSATRWQCSASHRGSVLPMSQTFSPGRSRTPWSGQELVDFSRESPSEDSGDSDSVFTRQLALWSQRLYSRPNGATPQQRVATQLPLERNCMSLFTRSCSSHKIKSLEEETESWDEEDNPNRNVYRNLSEERAWNKSRDQQTPDRPAEVPARPPRRCESVRVPDRSRLRNGELARTWSYKDSADKHVHFQEDKESRVEPQRRSNAVWQMLGQILMERGVPVRIGGGRAPLQIGPQCIESQICHGEPHQRAFHRAAATRHSFHGDIRERRRLSRRESSRRDPREGRGERRVECHGELCESHSSRRWNHSSEESRVRRTSSERRPRAAEDRWSSEEEQQAEAEPRRRPLQRSQSCRQRRRGASPAAEPRAASLYLGELQQVLRDEELARKLQREEEKLLRRTPQQKPCPEGDFRVAQVAQDEEIARFMQKQEVKAKRRSQELEDPASWHQHRAAISHRDRWAARERAVPRERLDSEGLPSPTEDCPPERLPPSPVSPPQNSQQLRNIAEELDPTFQVRGPVPEDHRAGQTGPAPRSGAEEAPFIPPTKRQTEKRSKAKDKKEGCKQQ